MTVVYFLVRSAFQQSVSSLSKSPDAWGPSPRTEACEMFKYSTMYFDDLLFKRIDFINAIDITHCVRCTKRGNVPEKDPIGERGPLSDCSSDCSVAFFLRLDFAGVRG